MEEHQEAVNPQNGSSSSTRDPEESAGKKEKHKLTQANHGEEEQQEDPLSPKQNKVQTVNEEIQADLVESELRCENKQDEEDKVDTFFSTMSHRYEAPPLL